MKSDVDRYVVEELECDDYLVAFAIRVLARSIAELYDEIEALKAEVARLKDGLEEANRYARCIAHGGDDD